MKKNLFYYLFAVICSVSLFTSCSDDDDEKVVCPVGETTFTDKSGLQLTYSSAPMLGKMVQFVPQGKQGGTDPIWCSVGFIGFAKRCDVCSERLDYRRCRSR